MSKHIGRLKSLSVRPRRQPAPLRVWVFLLAIAALAAGLTLLVLNTLPDHPKGTSVPWILIAVAMLGVGLIPVRFHSDRQTVSIDLFAIPMLIGAVFAGPAGMLLAIGVAVIGCGLIRGHAVVQILFNIGNQVAGASLALLVLHYSLNGHSPAAPLGWLALGAFVLTYELVTDIGMLGVMTLSSGVPDRGCFREFALQLALVLPLNGAVGIVAVEACSAQRWSLLVFAAPAFALALWYKSANRLRTRYADLQSLYGFTVHLAEWSERSDVLTVALQETRSILHCRHTELCVPQATGALRYTLDDDGRLARDHSFLERLERDAIDGHKSVVHPRGRQSEYLEQRGFADLLAVPISLGENGSALLLAGDRDGSTDTFEDEDLKLFETLAAHLSTALTSSGRLDRLRHEVAAREHEAHHDSLTGLANRALFTQVVTGALEHKNQSHSLAVMIMDLDSFKEVNDTLGHHTGDALLKEIGARLSIALEAKHLAARLGGDEFAFLIPSAETADEVIAVAYELLEAVSEPISIGGMVLSVRASIGIALSPLHGSDPASLLKRADVAMYAAKGSSRKVIVYDPRIDQYSTRRLVLATELHQAVESDALEVWYQPIANLHTGRIDGFEALLRWNHPELGSISPDEFIPVAEQTGLIEPLTWWVLRASLKQLARWRDDGYEMTVAVNVSARSLFDQGIVDRLRRLLAVFGVPPASLVLEITESSVMADSERSESILSRLSGFGVRIALDDFGTGYSSLTRLRVLPVHLVKIDRSFVKNMCDDRGDSAIVRSTIEMAQNMGHQVTAEGVEDAATWAELIRLGCDLAQGYHLAAAMPSEESRTWLSSRENRTLAPRPAFDPASEGPMSPSADPSERL